jgi:glycosyltransferase involved in cell wall biosynthesis
MTPLFSVVIPTFNRYPALKEVLRSLEAQSGAPPFEVIVCNDGSTDATPRELPGLRFAFPFSHLTLPQGGPAGARNAGVKRASGTFIAFFGDDTTLAADCLARHAAAHEARPGATAILGQVVWARELRVTRFMRYIAEYGLQFGYRIIPDPENVPFNFFYTSNISLPRRLFQEAGGFDETFPFAAWEDIELAYRLQKDHGMRMAYEPRAVTRHDHPTTIASFLVRQNKSGRAASVFREKHPEMDGFLGAPLARTLPDAPSGAIHLKARIASLFERMPVPVPVRWYREIMEDAYLRGLREALRPRPE